MGRMAADHSGNPQNTVRSSDTPGPAGYGRAVIEQLLDRVDMVELTRSYVEGLENRSGRWWARCPFHSEKTASFTINPERKSYYCFGCQEKGDAISLVMSQEHLKFGEALHKLAERIGFELPERELGPQAAARNAVQQAQRKKRVALHNLYAQVHKSFRQHLRSPRGQIARDYMQQRGITEETAEQFELGYAPEDGKALYKWLRRQNYSTEILAESGLFSQRYPEASLFWQRLVFPVFDAEGRVIAFSGRQLDQNAPSSSPKYINSRESPAYRKGSTLFGLYQSLKSLRRERSLILCEGNLDVLAWHQAGIANAAAPLGTAFTPEQARMLKRYCDKVILAFDGDEAGQKAIYKAAFLLEQEQLGSQIIPLAAGRDPADILQKEGADDLRSLAHSSLDFFNFLARDLEQRFALEELTGISDALRFLSPFMTQIKPGLRRELYIAQFARLFGLKQEVMAAEPSWHYSPPQQVAARPGSGERRVLAGSPPHYNGAGSAVQGSQLAPPALRPPDIGHPARRAKGPSQSESDLRVELTEREFWASMLLQADLYPEWRERLANCHWQSEDALLLKGLLDRASTEQNLNFETLCDRVSRHAPELGQWLLHKKLEPLQSGSVQDSEGYEMASYRQTILQQKYYGLQECWLHQRRNKVLQQIHRLEQQDAQPELSLELLREIQNLDGKLLQLRASFRQLQQKIRQSGKAKQILSPPTPSDLPEFGKGKI